MFGIDCGIISAAAVLHTCAPQSDEEGIHARFLKNCFFAMRLKKTHFIIALAVTAVASVSFTYVIVSTQWSIEPLGTGNAQNCPESRDPEVGLDTSELGETNIFKMIFSLVVRIGCTSESAFTLPEKAALWKFARNTRIPDDGELRHLEETRIFFGSV